MFNSILSVGSALAVVLGLVWLAALAARSTGIARSGPGERRLSLTQTLVLERERRMHLVRCDGRDLLIVTSAAGGSVLEWLPTRALDEGVVR